MAAGLLIGYVTAPGVWYEQLAKPAFTPPGWVFGPVWTVLYLAIGYAGWRVWRRDPRSPATKLWWGQLALNFLWSPAFFVANTIALALAILLLLATAILAFVVAAWRRDRLAALLFLPYAAWVAFAVALNASILVLN